MHGEVRLVEARVPRLIRADGLSRVRLSGARARLGGARRVPARPGPVRQGMGSTKSGRSSLGFDSSGAHARRGLARRGRVRPGSTWRGSAWQVRTWRGFHWANGSCWGSIPRRPRWLGMALRGDAMPGMASLRMAQQGKAWAPPGAEGRIRVRLSDVHAGRDVARHVVARPGLAWLRTARHRMSGHGQHLGATDQPRRGLARHV